MENALDISFPHLRDAPLRPPSIQVSHVRQMPDSLKQAVIRRHERGASQIGHDEVERVLNRHVQSA